MHAKIKASRCSISKFTLLVASFWAFIITGMMRTQKANQFPVLIILLGGVLFTLGSIFFFPFHKVGLFDLGCWLYAAGCVIYALVSLHILVQVVQNRTKKKSSLYICEMVAILSHFIGSTFYFFGSLFFLSYVGMDVTGAWCFVLGSVFLMLSSCMNLFHVYLVQKYRLALLQTACSLQQLFAGMFFLFPSIWYLPGVFPDQCRDLPSGLYWLKFWQAAFYLIGSVLFITKAITKLFCSELGIVVNSSTLKQTHPEDESESDLWEFYVL